MDVEVGQSVIFRQDRSIGRVLISDDKVAELKLLDQDQFQVRGLEVGSTDLWVWYRDDMAHPANFELTVHRDLSGLVRRLDQITAGQAPKVYPLVDRIAVDGPVNSVQTLEQISDLAKIYDPEFVNLMNVTGDHQIQLEVVFAEVNRTALREMGLNTLWGSGTNPVFTYNGQAQPLAAGLQGPNLTYSTTIGNPSLNGYVNGDGSMPSPSSGTFNLLGVIGQPINVSAILSVLEQNSISKILARPTLVALSGQQAEFLAGGEIPIPVAQFGSRITIEFKEYGVKLVFVPTVLGGDVVDMRVYVEVSDVDAATSIRLTGIEIPGFISRKSQSHLRVESGKTFAMAGMMHESMRATYAKVPVLGDIPVLGALFRYVQHRRTEDELMIFVTPRLVRPMAAGEVPAAPGTTEDNNPNDFELFLLGLDHRVGSQAAQPTGPVGLAR
jgi:pilus assembly protein CpaC